jgi:hypothetical protein
VSTSICSLSPAVNAGSAFSLTARCQITYTCLLYQKKRILYPSVCAAPTDATPSITMLAGSVAGISGRTPATLAPWRRATVGTPSVPVLWNLPIDFVSPDLLPT